MKLHFDSPTNTDEARIELLPLIDVVFCILTFFILAALQLTRQQAINVDLPKAGTGETQMQKMLVIGINDRGQTYLNQQQINEKQLERELKRFLRWNANGLVVLYAPKESRYNDVVQVLDQIRQVTNRVALATLPSSDGTSGNPNAPAGVDSNILTNPDGLIPIPGADTPPLQPDPATPDGSAPSNNPLLLPDPTQPVEPPSAPLIPSDSGSEATPDN
ncbi:MAG: biopolymer transporter ExbD [Microcoleaceae cyanobacterium]